MISVEQSQRHAIAPWMAQASTVVASRLRDARAHAEAGRMVDAALRLAELDRSIADGILAPARGQFLHAAFRDQKSILDPDIVDETVFLTPATVVAAKTAPIQGQDQYRAVGAMIDQAHAELKLATSIQRVDGASRTAYHESWERRHRDTITAAVHGHLLNAQIQLHSAIGFLLIRPDVR